MWKNLIHQMLCTLLLSPIPKCNTILWWNLLQNSPSVCRYSSHYNFLPSQVPTPSSNLLWIIDVFPALERYGQDKAGAPSNVMVGLGYQPHIEAELWKVSDIFRTYDIHIFPAKGSPLLSVHLDLLLSSPGPCMGNMMLSSGLWLLPTKGNKTD